MAAPSYATDLTLLNTCDGTTTGTWSEVTNYLVGGAPANEPDYYIQITAGTNGCVSKNMTGVGKAGFGVLNGSTYNLPVDGAATLWTIFSAPNSLATQASGGYVVFLGNSSANYNGYFIRGSDTYTYGGWICIPINPSGAAADVTGTAAGAAPWQYNGVGVYCPTTAPTKGQPLGMDVVRYGRCAISMSAGDLANGYAKFSGAAAQNDLLANRWGLLQAIPGGYQQQGLLLFGLAGTAVDFRDSNTNILIANTEKVTANFNTFEVRNSGSRVDLNAVTIQALGTVSRGRWVTTDNADINIDNCTFTDMSTFKFQSNSTINTTTFRRCGQVDQSGAAFATCTFDSGRDAVSLVANAPNSIVGCTFISDGSNHAMQITTSGSCTFAGHKFTGYVAGTGTSSTGNEVVYNTSGGSVTISVISGDAPSIRNSGSSTTTIITGQKTLTLSGIVSGSEVRIYPTGSTTQLAGSESVSGTFQYTYTYTADQVVNIVVFHVSYLPIYQQYTVGGSDATLPINQITDRQYLNP